MNPWRRRALRRSRNFAQRLGPYSALLALGCLMLLLIVWGTLRTAQNQGPPALALNSGVEILTTLITVAIVAPLVSRNEDRVIKLHSSLNFRHFTEQCAGARRQVQVFSTFTDLLQNRETDAFLANVRALLNRSVHVDFLLLHPDSLTADQRQRELRGIGTDVASLIIGNIHILNDFKRTLPEDAARYLSVRLYDANASVVMYRWDDKGLISFLAPDRLAEEGTHLEIDMRSPIGAFIDARFADIWSQPRTVALEEYMSMPLNLIGEADATVEGDDGCAMLVTARYVLISGAHYVESSPILHAQSLHPGRVLKAQPVNGRDASYDLVFIDPEDSQIEDAVAEAFRMKYREPVRIFIHLRPVAIV